MEVYRKGDDGSILQKMDKQINNREWGAKIMRKEKVDLKMKEYRNERLHVRTHSYPRMVSLTKCVM